MVYAIVAKKEKKSQRRNERWVSPQEWRKVCVRIGVWREKGDRTIVIQIDIRTTKLAGAAHETRLSSGSEYG